MSDGYDDTSASSHDDWSASTYDSSIGGTVEFPDGSMVTDPHQDAIGNTYETEQDWIDGANTYDTEATGNGEYEAYETS